MMAQLLATLHGGRLAGDTLRHVFANRSAAAVPMSAAQDKGVRSADAAAVIGDEAALADSGSSEASGAGAPPPADTVPAPTAPDAALAAPPACGSPGALHPAKVIAIAVRMIWDGRIADRTMRDSPL